MPITLDLKKEQLIVLPDGLHRFVKEKRNNILLLEREDTGLEVRVPEHKLVDWLGRGKAKVVDFLPDDGDTGPANNPEFGPGELWTEEDDPAKAKLTPGGRRALALQFYTVKWDECITGPRGDKGLQRLIDAWRPVAIQMGFEPARGEQGFRVKVAKLRDVVKHCGTPGQRPLRVFRSRRGKSSRRRFNDAVEEQLAAAVRFYWEKRTRGHNEAYALFRTTMEEINKRRAAKGLEPLRFPKKPEVLRRRINKATRYETWAQKYKRDEAHRKFKGIRTGLTADWPLELVIMDDTRFDTWSVLDTQTFLPLGRPTLTIALDVATRMVLGYLLSFEPPSLYSVLTTLKRVNKNKNYVRRLYPDIDRGWDGWGRPEELLVDSAWQYKAPSLRQSLMNLGISLTWSPVRTPQYKAIGERFFRTLNGRLAHKLPGGVPYNPYVMRQVGISPSAEAVIRLDDLDALMHETIIAYNHDKHTGIDAVPARVWRDKIAIRKRHFIADVTALDQVLGRVDTATLTTSGIRFKGMTFHEPEITSMLLDDLIKDAAKRSQSDKTYAPGRVKVVITWNPADAGQISVWNRGASPPHYVTLPNRDAKFFDGISFWHWEKIREFAEQQDLEFSSDAGRWKARDKLRKRWEALAGTLPMRESRDARRGLAFSQGTFDDKNVNEAPDIDLDTVIESEAEASTDGLNKPEGVSDLLAAHLLDGDNARPKGRTPSKKTLAKIKRTKARNREEAEEAKRAVAERKRRGNPSGQPVTRPGSGSRPNRGEYAAGEKWGDKLPDVDGKTAPLASEPPDDDFASGEGWD